MNLIFNKECEYLLKIFIDFEKSLQEATDSLGLSDILDLFEINIDKIIPFIYFQAYLVEGEKLRLMSTFAPDDISIDSSIIDWVLENGEISIIEKSETAYSHDVLYLPLIGSSGGIGVIVLWIDFDADNYTRGLSTILMLLGQIVSTRIEYYYLRRKVENSRSQLTDIVESVGHGILALDSTGKIILVNGTLEMMFGLDRSDIINKDYNSALSKDFIKIINSAITAMNSVEPELSMVLLDNAITIGVTASAMRISSSRDSEGIVILCRDLSATLELSKMREVDMMKNDFLSLVSHELRTPLTSILAYTEALMIEGMITEEEERKEYLEVIYNEGERLTRLINDVLDLTKMESGKMEYQYITCNLEDIIQSSITYSKVSAQKAEVNLIFTYNGKPISAYCDIDRITQVLLNIISNAIKFTPKGGKITLALMTEFIGNDKFAKITITDTGIGIAPEDLNRVFSRFEQIESLAHHSRGTGLGMPICKMIIEQGHRGNIGLTSKLGVGTQFFFTLPLETEEERD